MKKLRVIPLELLYRDPEMPKYTISANEYWARLEGERYYINTHMKRKQRVKKEDVLPLILERYITGGESATSIAQSIGVSGQTIKKWIESEGVHYRTRQEAMQLKARHRVQQQELLMEKLQHERRLNNGF